MSDVFYKPYEAPPINFGEILRYSAAKRDDAQTTELIKECLREAESKLKYNVCFTRLAVNLTENGVDFGKFIATSRDLKKYFENATEAVLFAATVGTDIDRLIAKYNRLSPAKALIFSAIGTERVESLCDTFCADLNAELKGENLFALPRVSAGYGDIPLKLQTEILKTLDAQRKIGITLSESLLMSPAKSVTAFVGITKKPVKCEKSCSACNKTDCQYRRT